MPYITQEDRQFISISPEELLTPGELNYAISLMLHQYIQDHGMSYLTVNTVIGVLECAKQELYRTIAGPYEDIKRKENGSVSNLDAIT